MSETNRDACPCGSGAALASCCQPFVNGSSEPPTAEALMRARYTAYATGEIDFIMSSQEADESADREATETWSRESKWHGLEIVKVVGGGEDDTVGTVEFIARYSHQGQEAAHHEEASFHKKGGRWVLADGKMKASTFKRTTAKVGPNEPCPCGSGKKHKKCCGQK